MGRSDGQRLHQGVAETDDHAQRHQPERRDLAAIAEQLRQAALQRGVQQHQKNHVRREDRAVQRGVGQQQQRGRRRPIDPAAALKQRAEQEAQQQRQSVAAGDHRELVQREVAETEQQPLEGAERRVQHEQRHRCRAERQVEQLHGQRDVGHARESEVEQIPQRRVSLRTQVAHQVAERRAVASDEPDLQLVAPHLVIQHPDQTEREKQTDDQRGRRAIGRGSRGARHHAGFSGLRPM